MLWNGWRLCLKTFWTGSLHYNPTFSMRKSIERYGCGTNTICFLPANDEKWAKKLLCLERYRIRLVVGAITGHCGLSNHWSKMGISNDPQCTCGVGEETGTIHLVCDPKFCIMRFRTLRHNVVRPLEVPILKPIALDRIKGRWNKGWVDLCFKVVNKRTISTCQKGSHNKFRWYFSYQNQKWRQWEMINNYNSGHK